MKLDPGYDMYERVFFTGFRDASFTQYRGSGPTPPDQTMGGRLRSEACYVRCRQI
jgi:hypothetical protein